LEPMAMAEKRVSPSNAIATATAGFADFLLSDARSLVRSRTQARYSCPVCAYVHPPRRTPARMCAQLRFAA
jgi:hypothetical protein